MRRIQIALIGLVSVIIGGSVVMHCAEGQDYFTCVYYMVVTLATVGYGDVAPVSVVGRLTAIVSIVSGVVLVGLLVGALTEMIVEGQVRRILGRRKLEKEIAALKDHYIVCGFGRIGSIVCRELSERGVPFVVVDHSPEALKAIDEAGLLYIDGDATDDDVLKQAGIMRARGLISVLPSDAENVYVTMSARELNRSLVIVARGEEDRTTRKLIRAGASRVVSPYEIGGLRMAHAILRPNVIDFIETTTGAGSSISMEEIPVGGKCSFAGKTLAESGIRQQFGVIIVAIRKLGGAMSFNPGSRTVIESGDVLITMGPEEDQQRLAASCG
jgi:voltage-gated potassium channel